MSAKDVQCIAAFRASFARRQAAALTEIPGGVAVLDLEYAASHEHTARHTHRPLCVPVRSLNVRSPCLTTPPAKRGTR
jgi:hypothetical protein